MFGNKYLKEVKWDGANECIPAVKWLCFGIHFYDHIHNKLFMAASIRIVDGIVNVS